LLLLDNPIQNYAWGSRTSLAKLLGRPPSATPEAELWIGAHPKAPSRLSDGRSLLDAIHADPDGMLGADVIARFGPGLPFLLKVLAVDAPLSLQAHPTLEQAVRGFAREQAAGLALDAPERTYKDQNHKPELLCALTPFEALSGFRPVAEAAQLFELLGVSSINLAAELRSGKPDALRQAFCGLMTLGEEKRASVTADVLGRCERARSLPGPFSSSLTWAVTLGARYPGDIGAVASLLLNHLSLAPLDAIYLEAGQLHAYLSGTGVEIMANSDNVLRGGLTPKHVDVPALLEVLRFEGATVELRPTTELPSGEVRYETPTPEFCLSRIDLGERGLEANVLGPEILLCVEGQVTLEHGPVAPAAPRILRRGQACFLSACCGSYTLRGNGRVFRATVVPLAERLG
jgi:mannose-6-phosphate isomerase